MLMFHVKHFEQLVKNNREVPALSIHADEQQPRSAPLLPPDPPALCDYEGSTYRVEFWTDARAFEDLAERRALHALLPPGGARLIEIGAGFGRLADLYAGYAQVILVEPALSMLRQAQERLGHDPRFVFVRANVYDLPLQDQTLDTVVMVRVLHHLVDVPQALAELRRIARPGGAFVLEFANKRNLKSILRFALRRQTWSPFAPEPYEFVPLNFDFHPAWVSQQLQRAGFHVQREVSVSHFRAGFFKRRWSAARLAALDGWLQRYASGLKLAPSIFVQAQVSAGATVSPSHGLFRCPACHHNDLVVAADALTCPACGQAWPRRDGIYDFIK